MLCNTFDDERDNAVGDAKQIAGHTAIGALVVCSGVHYGDD